MRRLGGGISDEIGRAIADDQFELHFQPIASITTGQIEALEALVRWNHPEQGCLTPALFLPAVEASDVAWLFSLHVIEMAAAHARSWIDAGHFCQVAVNISAQLVDRRLASELPGLLAASGVPPQMFALEITESAVMDDPISATRALDQLAELGFGGIAIDDFGTGHSSLGRLRDLPINALKIDRSFVAELDRGADPAFVRSVIDLAHYLDLRVIAEGVEDEQTWQTLARCGCDSGQGFWLSPPMPAEEIHDWLLRHDVQGLAQLGRVGDRRHGVGRRALDRIAGAFDRAPQAMLMSDPTHRWVAVNGAARSLLEVRAGTLLAQHMDDTAFHDGGGRVSSLLDTLAGQQQIEGMIDVTAGDGSRRRVRYELRRTMIPGHHVWVLSRPEH
jgi:EAL domain-containing protein (putative c-di-GMP-specific phosphodiesterase class I)